MPEITGPIDSFLTGKKATGIAMVPAALPNQRGPTCGFYAVSFVMNYWHLRTNSFGGAYKAKAEPLPARTHVEGPTATKVPTPNRPTKLDAMARNNLKLDMMVLDKTVPFTSLRQYGKFMNLTAFGSVFNAADLLSVARGAGSQYGGQYDGKAVAVAGVTDFADKVRQVVGLEVPVIVPYDAVGGGGEPGHKTGSHAHWVVIFAVYTDADVEYAVYFTWGKFYYAPLADFATSNAQLTSNEYVPLVKIDVKRDGRSLVRDYMQVGDAEDLRKKVPTSPRFSFAEVTPKVSNPEFNDPTEGGSRMGGKLDDKDGRHRMQVGGLRNRFVVVFRAEDRDFLTGQLPFLV